MRARFATSFLLLPIAAAAAFGANACGSSDGDNSQFQSTDDAAAGDSPATVGDSGSSSDAPTTRNDFPSPVIDMGAPPGAPGLFSPDAGAGSDASVAGPCLYEPEIGSLFPTNWLRPRFRFTTPNGENLFEIHIDIPNEASPLVIYTASTTYALDKAAWKIITQVAAGKKLHVRIRSMVVTNGQRTAGPFFGSEGDIEIAPVDASGTVVYWTTSGGTVLKGFKIGDESVQPVITPAQASTACVACHSSTPDGKYIGLSASDNASDGSGPAYITIRTVDGAATEPSFLSASAKALLARQNQHAPTFSGAHWTAGDHTVLTMLPVGPANTTEIVWTDLEATSQTQGTAWNVLARTGDPNSASSAAWSHDGSKVVYTSATASGAGTITNDGKLFTVPYANRAGGAVAAVAGADNPAFHHFYPTFSANDRMLAFNRVPTGQSSYNNAASEVFVIPAAGGTPTRLAANDPPACLGVKSPGVTNSWPKWSPEVKSSGGSDYYFLIFSSTRNAATMGPQLYVAPIVVTGTTVKSYAALYLWNQPEAEHNHTPAWDKFAIPPPK